MSIARWIGKAALVGALVMVAHGDAHALTRKHAYRPTESLRLAYRSFIINWRASETFRASFRVIDRLDTLIDRL